MLLVIVLPLSTLPLLVAFILLDAALPGNEEKWFPPPKGREEESLVSSLYLSHRVYNDIIS